MILSYIETIKRRKTNSHLIPHFRWWFVQLSFVWHAIDCYSITVRCDDQVSGYCFIGDQIELLTNQTLYIINLNQYQRPVETQLELRPEQPSNITSLDSIFDNFPHLKHLFVTNSLHILQPLRSRAQHLRHIDLHGNYIKYIGRSVLNAAHSLEYINLNSNRIVHIADEAFGGLEHLHELHIQDNELTSMTNATFVGLHGLRLLNLRGNRLTRLPVGAFTLIALRRMDLAKNRLVAIGNDTFNGLPAIRRISLAHNLIDVIDLSKLLQGTQIEYLDLSDNRIGRREQFIISCSIDDALLPVKYLNLAKNDLKMPEILQQLICFQQLEELNLNSNKFTRINAAGNVTNLYPNLRVLLFVGNQLDCDWLNATDNEFDASVIFTMPRLKDITHRGIACVPNDTLASQQLRQLTN